MLLDLLELETAPLPAVEEPPRRPSTRVGGGLVGVPTQTFRIDRRKLERELAPKQRAVGGSTAGVDIGATGAGVRDDTEEVILLYAQYVYSQALHDLQFRYADGTLVVESRNSTEADDIEAIRMYLAATIEGLTFRYHDGALVIGVAGA